MDFVTNWALRRRDATMTVAKEFSRWYGSNNASHESLAEAWGMFEMSQWKLTD